MKPRIVPVVALALSAVLLGANAARAALPSALALSTVKAALLFLSETGSTPGANRS